MTDEQRKDVERLSEALLDAAGAMDAASQRVQATYNDLLRVGLHQGDLAASLDAAGLKDLRQDASSLLAKDGYAAAEAASLAMVELSRKLRHAANEGQQAYRVGGGFGL